jgi:hypothetical protein
VNTSSLAKIAKSLRALPLRLGQDVAREAAPELTGLAQASYNAQETVYGDARPQGKDGPLTLHKTGKLQSGVKFTAIGTIVRAVLTVPYARYNIKYGILPRGGSIMPTAWSEAIADLVHATALKALEG